MAVEWTIRIEGRNEFGDVCRKAVRVDKSWERPFDGDLGLSIEDSKMIMTVLRSAVVAHEAETYSLFRRVCPDCHRFRPVKDYTTRQIRTVFGTVEVRNSRWMICQDCFQGMVVAFAPLMEICPDRATPELMELTARLGSMMPYRQAAKLLAESCPLSRPRRMRRCASARSGSARGSTTRLQWKNGTQGLKRMKGVNSKCSFRAIAARSSSSASIRLMFAAPNPIRRETSNATTLAESAVNSLVGKRMVKKQQMRWSLHGSHAHAAPRNSTSATVTTAGTKKQSSWTEATPSITPRMVRT